MARERIRVSEVRLRHFKGFEDFVARFGAASFLVGPNNAGKSTLVAALRASAQMLRVASRRTPDTEAREGGDTVPAYVIPAHQFGLVTENLRHEFHQRETRIEVRFSSGASLTVVWPERDVDERGPDPGHFFLTESGGYHPDAAVRPGVEFPRIGVVPVLAPVEQEEVIRSEKRLRSTVETSLASRHFRNHLALFARLDWGGHDFRAFVAEWAPEIVLVDLARRTGPEGVYLDLFYKEPGSGVDKEIFWAGDGYQIWLQILFHLYRLQGNDVILLDEPEVFLHPDLQRRLVRLLETQPAQTVTATHSSEILGEAPAEAVVWIARNRAKSVSGADVAAAGGVSEAIGTQFNLGVAKALRARAVLCVEGKDLKLLSRVAATVGAFRVAREADIAVIPLAGFSGWPRVEPFLWLLENFLGESVQSAVLLDRDYRPEAALAEVKTKLESHGIHVHIWRRKELESYLLSVPAISRLSGAPPDAVGEVLATAAAQLEHAVSARMLDEELRVSVDADHHRVTVTESFNRMFAELWADQGRRLEITPPKEVLKAVNRELDARGFRTVSFMQIAAEITEAEVPDEMARVLVDLNEVLAAPSEAAA
jgi:hypothetical protein